MAGVREPTRNRDIVEGRNNEVLNITEVRMVAFRFTDSAGHADVGLALCFGKDPEDGGPGVWVINPAKLAELTSVPHKYVRAGVRKLMERNAVEPSLPDGADLGDFGSEL